MELVPAALELPEAEPWVEAVELIDEDPVVILDVADPVDVLAELLETVLVSFVDFDNLMLW